MKLRIHSILCCFILLTVLFSLPASGQCMMRPVSLQQRCDNSEIIVLGKLKEKRCYWDTQHRNIYTQNIIEVTAYLKGYNQQRGPGQAPTLFSVLSSGGIVGDKAQITWPSVKIEDYNEYMFFLIADPTQLDIGTTTIYSNLPNMVPYACSQGTITKQFGVYHDLLYGQPCDESVMFSNIQAFTNEAIVDVSGHAFAARTYSPPTLPPSFQMPITSFTPSSTHGGTIVAGDQITINGSGFGAVAGTVFYSNADDGGATFTSSGIASDNVSWNNTQIVNKPPPNAGTGPINVNGAMTSASNLTVNYTHKCINSTFNGFPATTRQRFYHVNKNGTGGYTFTMNSAFSTNTAAKTSFGRALATWRCATLANIDIGTTTTAIATAATDGVNVVSFDATLPVGVLGQGTLRFNGSATAGCNLTNTVWWADEMDIMFFPDPPTAGFPWEYGPALPAFSEYDFESVAVHNLGHLLGLEHRIAAGSVMHFNLANGVAVRTPDATEIGGAVARMTYSSAPLCFNPATVTGPMILLNASTCTTPFLGPNLGVLGNAVLITNGDVTPSLTDNTDFGSTSVCAGTIQRNFGLTSLGTSSIQVSAITLSGVNASDFSITAPTSLPQTMSPYPFGLDIIVTVVFNPSAPGIRTATLSITSNDVNAAVFNFAIAGSGSNPAATFVSQTNVNCFGAATGSAAVSVAGGTSPYSYNWSPSGGTAATATGLTAQNYTCTVTDANSCTSTVTFNITSPTALAVTPFSQNNISCNGGSNGTASVTVSGGTTAYSYNWTPLNPTGDGTASVTGLTAQTYTCTVTDANSCVSTATFNITAPIALVVNPFSQTNVSCSGGSNGTASVNVSGGTTTYSYNWTPLNPSGDGTNSVTGLTAQGYTCTVTDANSCVSTTSFNITAPTALVVAPLSQTNVSCFGGSNGAASVMVSGGTTAYSYNWTPLNPTGDGTASVTGLTAQNYTCTVTDANSCVATQTFSIGQPSSPVSGATVPTHVSCFGGSDGAINLTPTGGTGPYTFLWLPSGPTTEDRTGLSAGTYTVQITDASGCTGTVTRTITQPTAPLSGTTNVVNVSCFSGSNGSIDLTPAGGTPGYTYQWLPSGPTSQDRAVIPAGTYSVQITDSRGCTTTVTATVGQPTAFVTGTTTTTSVSCFGGSNGTIDLTPAGGVGSYTFNWLPSGPTTEDRTGLTAGNYTVQITDANGCGSGAITVAVTQPATAVTGTTVPTHVACFGGSTGAINLTPSGGTGGYTFLWLPSGPTTEDRTGLTAGTYSVQITDANGCTATVTRTITQPSAPVSGTTSITHVSCFGGNNGTINLTPTGGTGPYSFNWLPSGPTTEDRTGLFAGTYTVQITDINGCTGTVTATVFQAITPITWSTVVTDVSCFGGNNGAINLTTSGGAGSYTYNWLPSGPTTEDRTGLIAGTYSVQITDGIGCTATVTGIAVTQPPTAVSGTTVLTNVACFGGNTGVINLTPSGGTGGYTFLWLPSGPTTEDRTGLTAGTYSVQITDANGCTGTVTRTITQPSAPVSGTTVVTNVSCFGGSNGTIDLTPTGGTAGYTYLWLPSGPTTQDRSGLTSGTYSVQITDNNGCVATVTTSVTSPSLITASISSTQTGCSINTGTASVSGVTGGAGGFTYAWSPSGGTGSTATGLSATTYSCVITDVNSCSITMTVAVTTASGPSLSAASQTNISCNGSNNGTATVNTASGGTGPYTYDWSPGSPVGDGSVAVTGLAAQGYTCTVTDANACSTSVQFTITEPVALSSSSSSTSIACNGGTATVTVTGTGGTAPYTGTGTFTVIAGTHSYTVTDANGCATTTSVVITQPAALAATSSATAIMCNGGPSTITVAATGGTAPYTGTGTFTVTAGTHSYTITDANGCSTTTSVVVTQPAALAATSSATSILCNGGSSTVTVAATGGTAPYTGTGTFTVTAGTHSYTITDANGCSTTTSVVVTQPAALAATSSATSILCNGGSSTVTVAATGGTAPYTGTGTFTVTAGTHSYTITDANGCSITTSVVVTQPAALAATSSATSILCNGGSSTVTVAATGGTAPYTGTGTFIVTAGAHSYTITDANGCTTSTSVTVTEPTALAATSSATPIMCNGGSATVTVVATGGTAPYTGTGTFIVTAGAHSYTITDANGCTTSTSVTVTEPTALAATSSATSILCNGGSSTITVAATGGTALYTGEGTFTVTAGTHSYTITDANGCTTSTSVTVTEPTALAAATSATSVPCNGGSATVTVVATGGTAPYTGEGTFTVTAGTYSYTVTDANGCTGATSITINEPTVLNASVATATNPSSCGGTDGAIDINVSGGTTAYSFLWSNSAITEDLTAVGAGTYSCTVTDLNGCTTSVGGNLNDPNAPTVTLSLAMDTLCVDDGLFTLSGESPAGGTFSGPGVSGGMFDPMTAGVGIHMISYTYTDISGCTGNTTDSIYVDICLGTTVPVPAALFSVYPNPNSGTFTLHLNTNTAADVLIYDAQGKLISTQKVQNSNQQITIAESGMYMITLITADGQQSSQRVIVTE